MPWYRSPVKLFGYTGFLLFLIRLAFPPADFAGAIQLHSQVHFFDFRFDLTGYGIFDFTAVIFLVSALAYYAMPHLPNQPADGTVFQIHFWSSVFFASFSVFLAHWVNPIPADKIEDPSIQISLNHWLTVFTWTFVGFLALQITIAVAGARIFIRNRNATIHP